MVDFLEIKKLNKSVKDNRVLKNINLKIKKSEVVGMVGLNGSGKTTLLKCVLGFVNFDGEVLFYGKSKMYKVLQNNIGFLIENPNLYYSWTGIKNIKFWARFCNDFDYYYVKKLADIFELDLHKKVKKYSLGMKQKLGIIIALMNKPDFLILDEPFNALDINSVVNLRRLLLSMKETTIIISSHDIKELNKICDRLILMKKGEIVDIINSSDFSSDLEEKVIGNVVNV